MNTAIDTAIYIKQLCVLGLAASHYLPTFKEGDGFRFLLSPDQHHIIIPLEYDSKKRADQEGYSLLVERLSRVSNYFLRQHIMAGIIECNIGGTRVPSLWVETDREVMALLSGYLVTRRFGAKFGACINEVGDRLRRDSVLQGTLNEYIRAAEIEITLNPCMADDGLN